MTRWLLALIVILCAACGSKQSLDSALSPTADYLEKHAQSLPSAFSAPTLTGTSLCVAISQSAIAKSGETDAAPVNNQIKSSFHLTLDNQPDQSVNFDVDTRTTVGSGGVKACHDVGNLASGLHMATIVVTTRTGTLQSYSWAFRVP